MDEENQNLLENDDEVLKSTITKISDAIQDGLDSKAKQVEKAIYGDISALQEEVEYLHSVMDGGNKNPYTDGSYIAGIQRNFENHNQKKWIRKLPQKLKESIDSNIMEDYYYRVGAPYSETPEEHLFFVLASRDKVKFSPFIANIKNTIRRAVCGTSVKIDIPHQETDRIVDEILIKNNFNMLQKGFVEMMLIDSEIMPILFVSAKGDIKIRTIDVTEIDEIEYDPDDNSQILAFRRTWYNDGNQDKWYAHADYFENLENGGTRSAYHNELDEDKLVLYFKYGFRSGKRGEVPFQPILRWDKLYEDMLLDLARLCHERAKVTWILRLMGKRSDVSRTTAPVRGASVKVETDNRRWRIENSRLSEHTSKEYGRPHRLAIASGAGLPEFLVFADASGQSYASIRKADSPFGLLIRDTQSLWQENNRILVRTIIRELINKNKLPTTVEVKKLPYDMFSEAVAIVGSILGGTPVKEFRESIDNLKESIKEQKDEMIEVDTLSLPVITIFPAQVHENPLIQTQAIAIQVELGLISKRTAMKTLGLTPGLETALINYEAGELNKLPKAKTGRKRDIDTNYDKRLDNLK